MKSGELTYGGQCPPYIAVPLKTENGKLFGTAIEKNI
jgi:hypothetical protein